MTSVFIADDHAIVRHGLVQLLREIGGFEVVGEAGDGREVLSAANLSRADVLVLDLSLPKVNGAEVLHRVKERHPRLSVVVLSMLPVVPYAAKMLAAGAAAYVSKASPPAELVAAMRAASRGERAATAPSGDPSSVALAGPHQALTQRELQVLTLVVAGRSVGDIAAEIDVHSCTVSNHLARIRSKLRLSSIADLVRYAHATGLANPGPRLEP